MNKSICVKKGVYRFDTENVTVLFDKENGLIINSKNKKNCYESLLEIEDILKEIKRIENE